MSKLILGRKIDVWGERTNYRRGAVGIWKGCRVSKFEGAES